MPNLILLQLAVQPHQRHDARRFDTEGHGGG